MVPASVELNVKSGVVFVDGVGTGVTTASVGAVVSIVKDGTPSAEEGFPAASVTVTVQLVYVLAVNALNVIVLLPEVVDVAALLHEPPYVIVPASVVLNVKFGVVSCVGVGTGVTTASVGADVSIVKEAICRTEEVFPAASVTVTVQSEYVPGNSASNVIVLVPDVVDVAALLHEPPYVMVPASVVENEKFGVVSFVGFVTGATTASVGAVVSIVKDGTPRAEDGFPAASVTVTVQFVNVPCPNALNVIVFVPAVVDVEALLHEPPYVMVPASVVENEKFGVVLLDGVGTGVTTASVGGVVSMVKDGTASAEDGFPAASVTVTVQFEYVPGDSVLNVIVFVPDVVDVVALLQEPPYVMVPVSVVENEKFGVVSFVGFVTGVTTASVGAVVSMVNEGTANAEEGFPAASVTVTVQFECAPWANVLNVTVLFPPVVEVAEDEQSPPYVMVPASVVENEKLGEVLFVGVGTGVTTASVGAVVSMVKDGTARADDGFPAVSVTVIVQFVYVPWLSALNVTVLLPEFVDVVALLQEPPYVMVPASVVENEKFGVVSFVGVVTGVTTASVGAVVSIVKDGTVNAVDGFPAASVTVTVQSE